MFGNFSKTLLWVCAFWLLLLITHAVSSNVDVDIDCIPLKLCPTALNLVKLKPLAEETIKFLRYSHCGYDSNNGPKVWCPIFSRCLTPDSHFGTCKTIDECHSYLDFMRHVNTSDPVVRKYLKEFRCNTEFDNDIKICCTDQGKHSIHERFNNHNLLPQEGECGQQNNENRIVGGNRTYLDEYPWLALFKYINGNKVKFACSGTLISERFVLTAAHCVDPQISRRKGLGKLESVILGEYDIRNETDCFYQKYGSDCADPIQEFRIDYSVLHPDYDMSLMSNDIAIIRLDKKPIYSDYVKPICLPSADFNLKENEIFAIAGWGRTENGDNSPVKRKAILNLASRERCNKLNGRRDLIEGQLCVGQGNGIDSCYGDSGGPLMLERNIGNGVATFMIGIVSYGYGDCGKFPGVYTYLPTYIDWIRRNIS